jgi:ABC-2 type transport system permease protein
MYNILILAIREFRTSVRTKSFIIGLIIAPIMMGGSLFVFALMKDRVDINEKKITVIDRTGKLGSALIDAAEYHNKNDIFDSIKNKQIKPTYKIDLVKPDTTNFNEQLISLSNRVRKKELHAFVVIGPDVIFPKNNSDKAKIKYFSENSFMDEIRGWMNWPLNNKLRQLRLDELGLDNKQLEPLFHWINVTGMGLVNKEDAGTEDMGVDAKESNPIETILIPYVFLIFIFMMVLMSAVPLLNSVMEEKTERIAEVLLGTVTPFQFMMGKVLGGISVSITGSIIYVLGGVIVAIQSGYSDYVPFELIPWFFVYMLLSIILYGSVMTALGSACNDSKDAQSLQFPAMLPIIFPMFVMMPILKEPLGKFATTISLIPPFTPFLMLVRQASPVSIPLWQPIIGLIGVILFTVFIVWAGGRIFRVFILMQGKRPNLLTVISFIFKSKV